MKTFVNRMAGAASAAIITLPVLLLAAGLSSTGAQAQPANNDPCSAIALTVGTTCTNTSGTVASATASTVAVPPCGSGNQDVWYTAVIPASGNLQVNTTAGTLTNGGMAIYTATNCATPATYTLLACNDNGPSNNMPQITLTCATAGATVYIRMWKQGGGGSANTFSICAIDPGPVASNDEPCGAIDLSVGVLCNNVTGTNLLSCASSVAAPSCGGYTGSDVWFKLTVPPSGQVTITADVVSGSLLTNGAMAAYTATNCASPATFTALACDDNLGPGNMPMIALTGQTVGQTIYIRFWANGGTAVGSFTLCATTNTPPNDDPCYATDLPVGTTCNPMSFTNVGGSNSNITPLPDCGNFTTSSLDVWFKFVVPATGCVVIETEVGSMTNADMAIYTANSGCMGTYTMLECDVSDGNGSMPFIERCGLAPGSTVYIRLWGSGTATGDFTICVHSPAMPATDCAYVLEMFDSGSDGWEGASLSVTINGGAPTSYTATGFFTMAIIPVNIGQVINVSYLNGTDNGDNLYYIRHVPSGRGVFVSSTPPQTAVSFNQTVDCNPPAMVPQDCIGGITLCNGQNITNNTTHTGFYEDLNTGNRGCLNANERQGTWYHFSPSSSGTIGFTINPLDPNDDYDFAIWGPYNQLTCIPPGAPLRCSFAEPPGVTGCGNGATDTSEPPTGDKWVSTFDVLVGEKYSMYISNYSRSGLSFDLSWQLTNGASLDCTVLPVELTSLDATPIQQAIDITWTTASEHNSDHFNVERSVDGITFERIATLAAAGNTQSTTSYLYTDRSPMPGINYYRLEQVDADGASVRTRVVSAELSTPMDELLLFPNPGAEGVSVIAPREIPGASVSMFDALGRTVRQAMVISDRCTFDASDLPSGFYAVEMIDRNGNVLQRATWLKRWAGQ